MKPNNFTPNAKRQLALRALRELFAPLRDGARLSWLEIQTQSGVEMNLDGKALVRLALDRLNRPYLSIPGLGVELSSGENGADIVDKSGRMVKHAIDRWCETTEQVAERHLAQMAPADQAKVLHAKALQGTLALSAALRKPVPPSLKK